MADDEIPIEGDDEVPSGDFEVEPENMEDIFSWFRRKTVALAEDAAELVAEGVIRVDKAMAEVRDLVDDNPEVEIATEFAIGSIFNKFIQRRIQDRLPETDPEFRRRFRDMMRKSLKDDEKTFDADYEVIDD